MFVGAYCFLLTISSVCKCKNLKRISVSFLQMQRRSDWEGNGGGSVGSRSRNMNSALIGTQGS